MVFNLAAKNRSTVTGVQTFLVQESLLSTAPKPSAILTRYARNLYRAEKLTAKSLSLRTHTEWIWYHYRALFSCEARVLQ